MSKLYEALRRAQSASAEGSSGDVTPPPAQPSEGTQLVPSYLLEAHAGEEPPRPNGAAGGDESDNGAIDPPHSPAAARTPNAPTALRRVAKAPVKRATAVSESASWARPDDDLVVDVQRIAGVLFRRKREVILTTILVLIPVAVATQMQPRLYRSVAQVQIEPEPVQVLPYRPLDQPMVGSNFEMFMRTQEQVLRGAELQGKVAERLEADPDASDLRAEVSRLDSAYSVQRLESTQLYQLSYVAMQPEAAARVANIFAEEFIKLNFEKRQAMRLKAKELLERELLKLEQRVQQSDRALVTYAQENSVPTSDPTLATTNAKVTELSDQLFEAEARVTVEKAKLAKLQDASVADFSDTLATPTAQATRTKVAQLEQELVVLRSTFGENWPTVVQKRSELKLAQEQLNSERAGVLANARGQAQIDYQLAEQQHRRLAESLAAAKQQVQGVEKALIAYNILQREVETNRKMYNAMLERLQQMSVAAGMEFTGLQLIQAAQPSLRQDSPRPLWNLALATLLGLGLGVCVAFVHEFWSASVRTIEELEQLTQLPTLGAVPHLSPPSTTTALVPRLHTGLRRGVGWMARVITPGMNPVGEPVIEAASRDKRAHAEAVRHVCASILLSRSEQPPQTMMVTSAISGEGKSTLARQVSKALSEIGVRTLLVECDFRRPTLQAVSGISSNAGLTLYLSGHGSFPVIHPTDDPNLCVVIAGPPAPNPPALLGSERMQVFLDRASSEFRFIVLDAPPVLPVADARVLAPLVDGVLLVVRAGTTSRRAVRRMTDLLEQSGTQVLGTILNAADRRDANDGEYGYYYHSSSS